MYIVGEYIHRYFPPEVIEQYRKQTINEWKSKQFKDKEIWERYRMSENAFYDLLKRIKKEPGYLKRPEGGKLCRGSA
jgi:Mor family transcriptional regulator